jgi:hypothetical protein
MDLHAHFPDDVVIEIAKSWLKTANVSVTLRKATARCLAIEHEYESMKDMYIQPINMTLYHDLLNNVPKVITTEVHGTQSCYVKLFSSQTVYPIYTLKYESTHLANIWMVHWLQRCHGVRRFGRHSPMTTFFLTNENKWIE